MGLKNQIFKFWEKKVEVTDLKASCIFFFPVSKRVGLEVAEMRERVRELWRTLWMGCLLSYF